MRGKRSSYDELFLRYEMGVFWVVLGVFKVLGRPLFLITDQIRKQDHQIDQKKLEPPNPAKVDTHLTLLLVYNMLNPFPNDMHTLTQLHYPTNQRDGVINPLKLTLKTMEHYYRPLCTNTHTLTHVMWCDVHYIHAYSQPHTSCRWNVPSSFGSNLVCSSHWIFNRFNSSPSNWCTWK